MLLRPLFLASILSGFIASAALANGVCPELTGRYLCPANTPFTLQIAQKMQNGVVTFKLNEEVLIADGKERPIGDNGDFNGVVKGFSKNGTLVRGLAFQKIPVWTLMMLSNDQSENLIFATGMKVPPGPSIPKGKIICIRQSGRQFRR